MEQNQAFVSVHKLTKIFEKIYAGLDTYQLGELDKELVKMYPSEESEVWFYSDYDEEGNSVGISIYITKPLSEEAAQPKSFDKLMSAYLMRADIAKLPKVSSCLGRMEKKVGEGYEVDFIPVHYTKKIDKYNIHFRIIKNQSAQ